MQINVQVEANELIGSCLSNYHRHEKSKEFVFGSDCLSFLIT